MTIGSTTSTTATGSSQTAASAPTQQTLGQDDFLKLLATQMQAQDPLKPMDDTQFVAQMASFTSLEQMKTLSSSFATFIGQQTSANAQAFLGKNVSVLEPGTGTITGTVSAVSFADGSPKLVVNGKSYDPASITSINLPATTTTTP